jgi:uncharacterized protein YndB with AHSA1/START domain
VATVHRHIDRARDVVFKTVADPDTYPHWLVGTRGIRYIEPDWPRPGTKFGHRVGLAGPLTVKDDTESLAVEPARLLRLHARFRPFGRAHVTFELADERGGTRVTMEEHLVGRFAVLRPVAEPLIAARNKQTLENLDEYVRGHG